MDHLQAMRLYTRIVELGSFSRASEQLDLPRASATQIIKQLEAHLGTRLLLRTTRQVRPTLDGDAYYQRCVSILADIDDMEASFSQAARDPRGRLKVDMSGSLCRLLLMPALPEFCARYPLIGLEISVSDRQIDLVREGVDCVLRIGELRDSALVARPLGRLEQLSCASADYLARHGTPHTLDDLDAHRMVDYLSASSGKSIPLEFTDAAAIVTRSLPSTVAVNNGDAYVAACEAGFGIVQMPRYHVTRQLTAGTLVEVLPDHRPPSLPLTVLYPQNRHLSPRVRVFIEWLQDLFSRQG
ncbi:LysR family transcriptional regulator [Zoogloea sp. LCSB751]|uniref:LysR family transcriptional regulator n=1 Tax=Zoogloea sp. LCSB751 TaxID=1965277 RepID=UPI0009A48D82|nr:LysR family transcriptional regulator [Zoogloea sp. LCSB751]